MIHATYAAAVARGISPMLARFHIRSKGGAVRSSVKLASVKLSCAPHARLSGLRGSIMQCVRPRAIGRKREDRYKFSGKSMTV